ncbi:hypothetical protein PF005_g8005 [Phytophthora fragariae]|uniref:RxLR effector protein n=1 Tax=Phytophthora fragariae TaxID=53985 RepID=A0A6A3SHP8_9STRA|nr:hypothetical protein PF003_g20439 [Phytophthora fragariae]KAE8944677.1 hypothetical protein PF009_g5637 [Phytophthora fragariae]KAE9016777.1 hypothetical protein PF011_g6993 [Phytophthora fragariae]KAE9117303.1 hypothetical protein PF007_g9329 [Phytophthora fragariae]KAE9128684.1 hypothetical protein PF010_g4411 [Phytophthora fragariae]
MLATASLGCMCTVVGLLLPPADLRSSVLDSVNLRLRLLSEPQNPVARPIRYLRLQYLRPPLAWSRLQPRSAAELNIPTLYHPRCSQSLPACPVLASPRSALSARSTVSHWRLSPSQTNVGSRSRPAATCNNLDVMSVKRAKLCKVAGSLTAAMILQLQP